MSTYYDKHYNTLDNIVSEKNKIYFEIYIHVSEN